MAEFRKASTDFKVAFEEEMRNVERQAREVERKKQQDAAAASAVATEEGTVGAAETTESSPAQLPEAIEPVVTPVSEAVARGSEEPSSTEHLDATETETSSGQEVQEKALDEPLHEPLNDEGRGHPV
jgi:phage gp29-like protein